MVVKLSDSTLGVQAISDLPFLSNQAPFGQYFYLDQDSDGFGLITQPVWVPNGVDPPLMFADSTGDCNDLDSLIHPAMTEVCGDSLDNNCGGQID